MHVHELHINNDYYKNVLQASSSFSKEIFSGMIKQLHK